MEEKRKKSSWDSILWVIIAVLILIVAYQFFIKSDTSDNPATGQTAPVINGPSDKADYMQPKDIDPEAAMTSPAVGEWNAYSTMKDFEVLMQANLNKTDFDFEFEDFEETPIYNLNNGKINFTLKGRLLTRQDLEGTIPLMIEFYANDQVSFPRRVATRAFDLPYKKVNAQRDYNGQYQYQFDFKKSFALNKGLYYFIIVPAGRNRVMYTNKIEVR